ncbi:hypothetical protein C8F01DRAFT_1136407, partial [Mycena amicta]
MSQNVLGSNWLYPLVCLLPVVFHYIRNLPVPPLPSDEAHSVRVDLCAPEKLSTMPAQPNHCAFFHKLPLELRTCIYEQALSGRRICLYIKDDKATNRRVVYSQTDVAFNLKYMVHGRYPWYMDCPSSSGLSVALLRTCRQIYLEAFSVVFQANMFEMWWRDVPWILSHGNVWREHIPIAQIRSLCVQYPYSFPYPMFERTTVVGGEEENAMFECLAALPALAHLGIRFSELARDRRWLMPEELHPQKVLETSWGRKMLELRESMSDHGLKRFKFDLRFVA